MPTINKSLLLHHDMFVVDASKNEQDIVDFLHANGIVETCHIYSSKENWFKVYHYIQLVGEQGGKLKYIYVKRCGRMESDFLLSEITVEYFKKYVLELITQSNKN